MSVINDITDGSKYSKEDDEEQIKTIEIFNKFKIYRRISESNERKLKEAEVVISQLKDSINTAIEVEKNLRNQIQSSQNRLMQMQKNLSKLITISEKQIEIEKMSEQLEKKVDELNVVVKNLRDQSKDVFRITSNEFNLIKRNTELKTALKEQESSYDLLKIELQISLKEKKKLETEFQEKNKRLSDDLEKSQSEATRIRMQCDATLSIYKKQIEDNEQIIREYEKERQHLLDDFEIPSAAKISKNSAVDITWADSTVATTNSESSLEISKNVSLDFENSATTLSRSNPDPESVTYQSAVTSNVNLTAKKNSCSEKFSKMRSGKHKPQLDIVIQSKKICDPVLPSADPVLPPKRRLFSTNCNHYLN